MDRTELKGARMAPVEWPGTVAELSTDLGRQRDLYRALLVLASRQEQALTGGDTAVLLEIVEHKRRLLAAGEEVDRHLAPWRAHWSELRATLPAADRPRIEALIDEVGAALEELLVLEDRCTKLAEQGVVSTGEEIRKVVEARKVKSAYKPAPPPADSRFLDQST